MRLLSRRKNGFVSMKRCGTYPWAGISFWATIFRSPLISMADSKVQLLSEFNCGVCRTRSHFWCSMRQQWARYSISRIRMLKKGWNFERCRRADGRSGEPWSMKFGNERSLWRHELRLLQDLDVNVGSFLIFPHDALFDIHLRARKSIATWNLYEATSTEKQRRIPQSGMGGCSTSLQKSVLVVYLACFKNTLPDKLTKGSAGVR